jgi:Zn-dependent protease
MKWSLPIARVAGIRIQVHITFPLLLAWIALSYWQLTGSAAAVIDSILFILALFVCVVLHELGHALAARHYGIGTSSITLLPIGGVAAIERTPDKPREEMLIALAGPAVSLGIALALWAWLEMTGAVVPVDQIDAVGGPFLQRLMAVNFLLAVFNLVPAFPMDGGRVFRAALSIYLGPARATRTAAGLAQLIALGFALLGLLYNPMLFLIAVFIWIGARAESSMAGIRFALEGTTARDLMLTRFQALSDGDRLSDAMRLTLSGSQKDFPVLGAAGPVGLLSQADLLTALHQNGPDLKVIDALQTEFIEVRPETPMARVLDLLQESPSGSVLVNDNGVLVGIVNLDNLLEWVRLNSAMGA